MMTSIRSIVVNGKSVAVGINNSYMLLIKSYTKNILSLSINGNDQCGTYVVIKLCFDVVTIAV